MRAHTDKCGQTGSASVSSCKLACACWCHRKAPVDNSVIDVRAKDYTRLVHFAEIMGGVLAWAKDHGASVRFIQTMQREQRAVLKAAVMKGR